LRQEGPQVFEFPQFGAPGEMPVGALCVATSTRRPRNPSGSGVWGFCPVPDYLYSGPLARAARTPEQCECFIGRPRNSRSTCTSMSRSVPSHSGVVVRVCCSAGSVDWTKDAPAGSGVSGLSLGPHFWGEVAGCIHSLAPTSDCFSVPTAFTSVLSHVVRGSPWPPVSPYSCGRGLWE
jgi:hypothetical protein